MSAAGATSAPGPKHRSPFDGLDAPPLLERLARLDTLAHAPRAPAPKELAQATAQQQAAATQTFDVVLLGGGLSLIYAPLLLARGLSVAIVERHRIAQAHREWNASSKELAVLVAEQLLSPAELEALVVARYRAGRCRWAAGGETQVQDVLDCAVDAQALLDLLRSRAAALGATFFEDTEAGEIVRCQDALLVATRAARAAPDGATTWLGARVVLEGRGAASPWAAGDLVCPTVGGVLAGLEEGEGPEQVDRQLGDILVTTEGVEEGRQHIWEAFPTRPGEVAVYLFYYAERHTLGPAPLARLYERFWRTLPRFKRGAARLVRPTFGIIPGWSRLAPGPTSPHERLVLVGDAASRHSPLTFCGFGATLRSIAHVTQRVAELIKSADDTSERGRSAVDDQPLHRLTGALALMIARADVHGDKQALNCLLDASFATLASMPNDAYGRLLRDEMSPYEVTQFMWQTSRRHPQVWRLVFGALGVRTMTRWAASLARGSSRH